MTALETTLPLSIDLTPYHFNIFDYIRKLILDGLTHLQQKGDLPPHLDLSRFTVEVPKTSSHGDLSTNAAMVFAKEAGISPRELAQKIISFFQEQSTIENVSMAGPGFINLTLPKSIWQHFIPLINREKNKFGTCDYGHQEKVNVEYVSANPTGPLHAGHGRSAVIGDTICSLLKKIGYDVTREYYINDVGGQATVLARSCYLRYLQALGHKVEETQFEGLYPGSYLIKVAEQLKKEVGNRYENLPEDQWLSPLRSYAISAIMSLIKEDLEAIGIYMDVFTSEKSLVERGLVDKALQVLQDQGLLYEGTLERPKGHDVEDWEERPQLLFKATAFGDDTDRSLKKSDGSWTYFAGDAAYHYDKFTRGYNLMIDSFGADHIGHIKRLKAVTQALTQGKAQLEIKTCQLVNFIEQGKILKMSKRAGTFVTLRDLVDRVGKDVTRFIMLTRHQDMTMDFDFAKVVEQTKDNPVFYVQYAHARCHSVLRHAQQHLGTWSPEEANLSLLSDESEIALIKLLAHLPQQIKTAALNREPHRLAHYTLEVAGAFHALWNKGKENTQLRFIETNDKILTSSRLSLIQATMTVLANCFEIFGITPVEEMHS